MLIQGAFFEGLNHDWKVQKKSMRTGYAKDTFVHTLIKSDGQRTRMHLPLVYLEIPWLYLVKGIV